MPVNNKVHEPHQRYIFVVFNDVPLVEFMYLVFTGMPGEGYHRQLRSLLLCLCDVFQLLMNSLAG